MLRMNLFRKAYWLRRTTFLTGFFIAIGNPVKGGVYSDYPSLKVEDLLEGDLHYNTDFRGIYGTMVEKWLGLDAVPVVGGHFEQPAFV